MPPKDRINKADAEAFSEQLRGDVLTPGEEGYDEARTIWNAMIDREPAIIARCTGAADVITAVNFARENEIQLSVKSGGHHVSGVAVCDDGLMVDLSEMDAIRVDPDEQTARVQAGATWGDVDHETQQFGLAVPGGEAPTIGVAGLTLGGGFGWLSRKYGLTSDNLRAVDVVTADGDLIHASEEERPELFWALRGGGGNFGIVTSFEFEIHDVGPDVLGGSLIYSLENTTEVARQFREFMAEAPNEASGLFGVMELPEASIYPEEIHNTRVAMIVAFYGGPATEGESVLASLREFREPIVDSIRPRSYKAFQRIGGTPESARTYLRSQFLDELSDPVIETIVEYCRTAPSAGATVFAGAHDGAITDPPTEATAYSHREDAYRLLIETRWRDPARDEEHIEWVRSFHEALRPYTTDDVAINFLTEDELEERVTVAHGQNYERLVAVKNEWDPENLFRLNPQIEPTE